MEKLEEKFQQQFEVLKKEFDQKLQNKNNMLILLNSLHYKDLIYFLYNHSYGDAEQAKNELVNQLQSQINKSVKKNIFIFFDKDFDIN